MHSTEPIVIPGWLAKLIGGLFSAAVLAGTAWAWTIQQDVAVIKAELRGVNEMRTIEIQDIRRRLDRIEDQLGRRVSDPK